METKTSVAYNKGYDAGYNSKSEDDNPYEPQTKEYEEWDDGYNMGAWDRDVEESDD